MAKAQVAARFMTEVAPPQIVTVMRRRKLQRSGVLDTIAEDDRELQLSSSSSYVVGDQQLAAPSASSTTLLLKRASSPVTTARAGGFMRELGSCFSSSTSNVAVHGQTAVAGAGSFRESRHKGHGRRVVYAHQLH